MFDCEIIMKVENLIMRGVGMFIKKMAAVAGRLTACLAIAGIAISASPAVAQAATGACSANYSHIGNAYGRWEYNVDGNGTVITSTTPHSGGTEFCGMEGIWHQVSSKGSSNCLTWNVSNYDIDEIACNSSKVSQFWLIDATTGHIYNEYYGEVNGACALGDPNQTVYFTACSGGGYFHWNLEL
jgi:hypothetical protein